MEAGNDSDTATDSKYEHDVEQLPTVIPTYPRLSALISVEQATSRSHPRNARR